VTRLDEGFGGRTAQLLYAFDERERCTNCELRGNWSAAAPSMSTAARGGGFQPPPPLTARESRATRAFAEGLQNTHGCSAVRRANIAPTLSAAFHNADADARTDLTHRYQALCAH